MKGFPGFDGKNKMNTNATTVEKTICEDKNLTALWNNKEAKLSDGTHRFLYCLVLKLTNVNSQYASVGKNAYLLVTVPLTTTKSKKSFNH